MKLSPEVPLTIAALQTAYRRGHLSPTDVIEQILARCAAEPGQEAWIHRVADDDLRAAAAVASARLADDRHALDRQPLLGIPFAVKDNIDVAGLPTTAACPAFARQASRHATVVQRLLDAGAIVVGKTNLDQFATGLVGTRSPYGAVGNPFDPRRMSGGSSSGSAAVTARGWVAFALGTDTAGSGRVPAGACNLVGLKPTPGLVSTAGVLPACRSLDCVSVFAHTVADGWQVLSLLAGADPADPWTHAIAALGPVGRSVRVGIPRDLTFLGDVMAEHAWNEALARLRRLPGVTWQPIDLAPFQAVAQLLYDGPWVAERRAAVGDFFDQHGDAMDPVVRAVIGKADNYSAVAAFRGRYALAELRRQCEAELAAVDAMLVPTAPGLYSHEQIARDPIGLNSQLGLYTNFVNLLDMAALALPGPFRADGMPAGVTLLGLRGSDHRLAELGRQWQPILHQRLGMSHAEPGTEPAPLPPLPCAGPTVDVAVVGAHLSGLPLHWQLTERGAAWVEATTTAPHYRLYALPDSTPAKPGLVPCATGGAAIAVEVWRLPLRTYGSFVAGIPAPLGIGTLVLADGRTVQGFVCDPTAVSHALDITHFGGWRAYLASSSHLPPSHSSGVAA